MSDTQQGSAGGASAQREHLRHRVHRYLNLPVALAAILFVLVAFTHISGSGTVPWRHRFWHGPSVILLWAIWAFFIAEFLAKFALAPHKPTYLRRHWFDAIVALLPICGVLRLIEVVLISPLVRLIRGEEARPHLAILAKRKLDKLALISALVVLIVAVLAYIFENGAKGATISTFGDALWWAAATATTVGNQLYPVTIPGEILAFFLMLFAIGVFSYLTSLYLELRWTLSWTRQADPPQVGRGREGALVAASAPRESPNSCRGRRARIVQGWARRGSKGMNCGRRHRRVHRDRRGQSQAGHRRAATRRAVGRHP